MAYHAKGLKLLGPLEQIFNFLARDVQKEQQDVSGLRLVLAEQEDIVTQEHAIDDESGYDYVKNLQLGPKQRGVALQKHCRVRINALPHFE